MKRKLLVSLLAFLMIFNMLNLGALSEEESTLWDLLAASIVSDDMLYTQSVLMIDGMMSSYAEIFRDELFKITTNRDGSQLWSFTLSEEDFVDLSLSMAELTGISMGMPLDEAILATQKEVLEAMKCSLTMKMTVRNNAVTKAEVLYNLDTGKLALDGSSDSIRPAAKEPAIRMTYKINAGESTRSFDSGRDKKISVPQNVMTLEELLGFSLEDYAALSQ